MPEITVAYPSSTPIGVLDDLMGVVKYLDDDFIISIVDCPARDYSTGDVPPVKARIHNVTRKRYQQYVFTWNGDTYVMDYDGESVEVP